AEDPDGIYSIDFYMDGAQISGCTWWTSDPAQQLPTVTKDCNIPAEKMTAGEHTIWAKAKDANDMQGESGKVVVKNCSKNKFITASPGEGEINLTPTYDSYFRFLLNNPYDQKVYIDVTLNAEQMAALEKICYGKSASALGDCFEGTGDIGIILEPYESTILFVWPKDYQTLYASGGEERVIPIKLDFSGNGCNWGLKDELGEIIEDNEVLLRINTFKSGLEIEVRDQANFLVSGAKVIISQGSFSNEKITSSDSSDFGSVEFSSLEEGNYNIEVSKGRYSAKKIALIRQGEINYIIVTLPMDIKDYVYLFVYDGCQYGSGRGIAGASIQGSYSMFGTTSNNGIIRLPVGAEATTFLVSASQFDSKTIVIDSQNLSTTISVGLCRKTLQNCENNQPVNICFDDCAKMINSTGYVSQWGEILKNTLNQLENRYKLNMRRVEFGDYAKDAEAFSYDTTIQFTCSYYYDAATGDSNINNELGERDPTHEYGHIYDLKNKISINQKWVDLWNEKDLCSKGMLSKLSFGGDDYLLVNRYEYFAEIFAGHLLNNSIYNLINDSQENITTSCASYLQKLHSFIISPSPNGAGVGNYPL
ncbi:MAG: hypothetical protein CEN91_411, partial [Candidatus Berkelbacteria bacterium Licking1014_85]